MKKWYQSRTMWGIILAFIMSILMAIKEIAPDLVPDELIAWLNVNFVEIGVQVGVFVGLLISWIGRMGANTPIERKPL